MIKMGINIAKNFRQKNKVGWIPEDPPRSLFCYFRLHSTSSKKGKKAEYWKNREHAESGKIKCQICSFSPFFFFFFNVYSAIGLGIKYFRWHSENSVCRHALINVLTGTLSWTFNGKMVWTKFNFTWVNIDLNICHLLAFRVAYSLQRVWSKCSLILNEGTIHLIQY